jgi:hypothetical protein
MIRKENLMAKTKKVASPTAGQPLPPIPAGLGLPFYYSSLSNCEILYLVDAAVAASYLQGTGLELATFDGKACVSFNHQLYTAQFPSGASITQEIELNILSYPASLGGMVASVSFEQFVLGDEQSKILGNHRVWVPCDADLAIKAGKELFGEPKFKTSFTISIPSPNDTTVTTWSFTCQDPTKEKIAVFTCTADLRGLDPILSNPAPHTEYGTFGGRLIGCRWNVLSPYQTCFLGTDARKRVKLTIGKSEHPMAADMKALIGSTPAVAVRTFQSAAAATQSRAYYPVA